MWPKCERFLPHAMTCAALIEQEQMASLEDALLVYQTGMYLTARLRLSAAEPLLQRAFAICEKELGASHPLTIKSLSNLASLYQLQGKYDQAESLFQRAITLFETELETDDPLIIETLNNFAMLYHKQGKYTQAMPLLWRAYFLSLQAFGPIHFSVARCLVGLAALHQAQDELDEAEAFYHQAVALSEQLSGPDGPYVAICLNNLSIVYRIQKKYTQAEAVLTRALSIGAKTFDPTDPFLTKSLGNLAGIYHLQGKDEQAEPLFHQALTLHEQSLGADHPAVAIALNELAEFYRAQGKLQKAEPLLRRAVAIGEKLDTTNPERLTLFKNYASLLHQLGQDEEANKLTALVRQDVENAHATMPKPLEGPDKGLTAYEVFTLLDRIWNQTEKALKKQLTIQERTRVERVKQILWLLLEDLENDVKQELSTHVPTEPDGRRKELTKLLQQSPFSNLDEHPDLRHIPGIGYVSDDFPFESVEDIAAGDWWSNYSYHGFIAYTRFLVLLRHFMYLPLSSQDKASLRKLREAIAVWRQDWLEGPLPDIHYTGPSETAQGVVTLLDQSLFRKKHEEIFHLPDHEVLTRLHPDDIQQINSFKSVMAQRFEIVKGQLIEDLKKMGKLP